MKKALGRDLESCKLRDGKKLISAFSSLIGEGVTSPLPSIVVTDVSTNVDMTELSHLFQPSDMLSDEKGRIFGGTLAFNAAHQSESRLTDKFLSMALVHLYRVASLEVKRFNSKEWISKVATEQDGILFARNRLYDGLSFMSAGEMLNITLGDLGINIMAPMIDRYSELAY